MKEIVHVLETIKKKETIEGFIGRQDLMGCTSLVNVLRYANKETEENWLKTYNKLWKY